MQYVTITTTKARRLQLQIYHEELRSHIHPKISRSIIDDLSTATYKSLAEAIEGVPIADKSSPDLQ
jgi:hypothetical protein